MSGEELPIEFRRQLQWFDPENDPVPTLHIIGCGGINSFVAFYLAQMGVKDMVLWDSDIVEAHNIPNQNFLLEHVGMRKTDALAALIKAKTGVEVRVKNRFFRDSSEIEDENVWMIVGTDSIESRGTVWEYAKRAENVKRVIDGRLGGLAFQIFNVDPHEEEDVTFYDGTIFAPEEASELPCTAKSIIFIGAHIGALMCQQFLAAVKEGRVFREISIDHLNSIVEYDGKPLLYGGAR